jgi:aminopeptidase-like protein
MAVEEKSLAALLDDANIGEDIYALAAEIFPICRSITGDGVRETLSHLARHIGLNVTEVPTGTQVFDWTVPREWNIREAYIANEAGARVVDFRENALHVLNYSVPVRAKLPLSELKKYIHTLPEQPDLIPYRTSYYSEAWGFCMEHDRLAVLPDGTYEAVIDADLSDGHLTYGEYLHVGQTTEEFLFSTHICHPALANDNCSGLALATLLAKRLSGVKTRFTYRFVFAPGTIGAITWLAQNEARAVNILHGLVLSCVGDAGGPTYKRSRLGDAPIDRAMAHVLWHSVPSASVVDFSPYGYDERQYCSPGFNLPVGMLQRSQFGTFPEYHTSADNLDFIRPEYLAASYRTICAVIDIIENNQTYLNTAPKCEPQLGRRGLYDAIGGAPEAPTRRMAMLWTLNLSDGAHSLLDIAERAELPFAAIHTSARLLQEHGLLAVKETN